MRHASYSGAPTADGETPDAEATLTEDDVVSGSTGLPRAGAADSHGGMGGGGEGDRNFVVAGYSALEADAHSGESGRDTTVVFAAVSGVPKREGVAVAIAGAAAEKSGGGIADAGGAEAVTAVAGDGEVDGGGSVFGEEAERYGLMRDAMVQSAIAVSVELLFGRVCCTVLISCVGFWEDVGSYSRTRHTPGDTPGKPQRPFTG